MTVHSFARHAEDVRRGPREPRMVISATSSDTSSARRTTWTSCSTSVSGKSALRAELKGKTGMDAAVAAFSRKTPSPRSFWISSSGSRLPPPALRDREQELPVDRDRLHGRKASLRVHRREAGRPAEEKAIPSACRTATPHANEIMPPSDDWHSPGDPRPLAEELRAAAITIQPGLERVVAVPSSGVRPVKTPEKIRRASRWPRKATAS